MSVKPYRRLGVKSVQRTPRYLPVKRVKKNNRIAAFGCCYLGCKHADKFTISLNLKKRLAEIVICKKDNGLVFASPMPTDVSMLFFISMSRMIFAYR